MEKIIFGRTGLSVGRTGFGCIPIQRITFDESTKLLRHAYDNGVTLYDTATGYTTSEEQIGIALGDVRKNIVICTKSFASSPDKLMENIENSLNKLKTDYIDVYQFHNPSFVPLPDGEDGFYNLLLKAKKEGKILHIGITQHSRQRAYEAVDSGFYDVLQYPFSYLTSEEEMEIVGLCKKHNVGILAMKAMCGGILSNAAAAFAFLRQFENIVPIWGLQFMSELDEMLALENNPPMLNEELLKAIDADKKELTGLFCRACGYCLPCPAGIPIPMAARMSYLLRRMVAKNLLTDEWKKNMRRIEDCTNCGHCIKNCPYGLDTPKLLKEQHAAYFINI